MQQLHPLPVELLQSLSHLPGFNKEEFQRVHLDGSQINSIRLNPLKAAIPTPALFSCIHNAPLPSLRPVPWCNAGYYVEPRPSYTFSPLFHAGVFYVQEASSMFLAEAMRQCTDLSQPLRVLDLCAAPGGKSTLLQSLVTAESLLVSNEVIKSRCAVLTENITKWGSANIVVTNNDPVHFARLADYFQVMVIDAPCSGSGLFRRDSSAIVEWSKDQVDLCSRRQQRILADAWPALEAGGILIYSTCSYSVEENENILDWMGDEFAVESLKLNIPDEWNIVESQSAKHAAYGYRFYPDKVQGEGLFIAVLRKKDGDHFQNAPDAKAKQNSINSYDRSIVEKWLQDPASLVLERYNDDIIAIPAGLAPEIETLSTALYIKKAGVAAGRIAGKDFIPDHALALSKLHNNNIPAIELQAIEAIQYLQRADLSLSTSLKGWVLCTHQGHALGWVKILPNRINNYYPKQWRIVKRSA